MKIIIPRKLSLLDLLIQVSEYDIPEGNYKSESGVCLAVKSDGFEFIADPKINNENVESFDVGVNYKDQFIVPRSVIDLGETGTIPGRLIVETKNYYFEDRYKTVIYHNCSLDFIKKDIEDKRNDVLFSIYAYDPYVKHNKGELIWGKAFGFVDCIFECDIDGEFIKAAETEEDGE